MTALDAAIAKEIAKLPPQEQAQLKERLAPILVHRKAIQRFPTPGHLAQFHRAGFLQTPMLDQIDAAIMAADAGDHRRWIINTPPQEGKTTRLQDGCAWLLLRRPHLRIAFASYEQGIAAQSGLSIRQLIETHGGGYNGQKQDRDHVNVLGLSLDPDRALNTNWSLSRVPGAGKTAKPGGVLSVGIGSSLTGRAVDVLVIDDPLKDAKQADSEVYRKAVINWYQSVATTRLSPGAIVIVIQTRWHLGDLTGWLLDMDRAETAPVWKHLNIPAQAKEGDALGRQPGEYLTSARNRSVKDWEATKKAVGTRWWFALYQGDPSPPEGGTFKRAWFEANRVSSRPEMKLVITVVDPADNTGDGDEAGVVTGGIGASGEFYILEDNSGHYTVAGWVRAALYALLRNGSSRIMYEQSLSGLKRSIAQEWLVFRRQARDLAAAQAVWSRFDDTDWRDVNALAVREVVENTSDADDSPIDRTRLEAELMELWPFVPQVLALPETGPPVQTIKAVGSKAVRAELISPEWESGRVHHVGHFPTAEQQMAVWLPSQDSPDRMDAFVHLVTELSKVSGAASVHRAQGANIARRQPGLPQIMRTTRSM